MGRRFCNLTTSLLLIVSILFIGTVQLYAAGASDATAQDAKAKIAFTDKEKEYISSHKSVKIGYVQDRIPISFKDENGEFNGISRYIFDRVSELCGIDFEYAALPGGEVTYDVLLDGGYDLVSSVEYNEENQKAKGILISNPYLSSKKVVVARKGFILSYNSPLSIAISTGSQTIKKVLGKAYPNFKFVDYPSINACFDAVNSGEADLLMQNQFVVEYWKAKPIYENLKVIPVLGLDDRLCFSAVVAFGDKKGPSAADGRILIDILNKVIAAMPEDEVGNYTIQGVMENQYKYNFSDFMYRYRFAVRTFATLFIVIMVLLFLLVRLNLRYAANKADAKVRGQFLNTMSHEIRTPLNGLVGLNHLMENELDNSEKLGQHIRQSNVTAKYLLSLVDDMLDMSSLQEENLKLDAHPIDLKLVIDTINSVTQNALQEKKIRYSFDCDINWQYIVADEARIQQVILNLLDNARKFTPKGGMVDFSVKQELKRNNRVLTTVTVSDTGVGIGEEFKKHIFDTFARELDTVSKGNQGTGLGLPICRQLAKLMGGDISFESEKGKGSIFTFTFYAGLSDAPKADTDAEAPEKPAADSKRILVAEDNELNGEIMLELLRGEGYEAELAQNGKIAVNMFSQSQPYEYSVILMDLLMPEMDGFEATEKIRALDRPDAKTVRIFACTANSSDSDKKRAAACGMNDFITKPIDIKELFEKLK